MTSSPERELLFRAACESFEAPQVVGLLRALIDERSASGAEGVLARRIVELLDTAGLHGEEQQLDDLQSNAIGRLAGLDPTPALLLYSPIDTVTSDDPQEDVPWASLEMPPEMRAKSWVTNEHVFGLGAQNPKGHAACIIAAAAAIQTAGISLQRTVQLGFGAGGMPTNARAGTRPASAHGAGCEHMLQRIPRPEAAVIAKSGWAVSWEEVGLAWYEVRVFGTHTYVGSRHLLPYSNAIASAAKVIQALEDWFPTWAELHRSGLVAPQGIVSFIEGGVERTAAFTPAVCRFRLDLRLSPRTTPAMADAAIAEQLAQIAATSGVRLSWQRVVTIPGTTTDPNAPIIKTAIAAWEALEAKPHQPVAGLSGATDANILRAHGIPTARVGLAKAQLPGLDFQQGMNCVSVADLCRLTRLLIHLIIATAT
jgi:acetylornithine deacetylase/succinyl-diaminopimelate desuccinylase-like protein